MGSCPDQNTDTKDTTPEVAAAAALRYTGQGFLFGFLLCAILAGALMWQLRQPAPPPIVLHPPPTEAPTATALPTATPGPLIVFVSGGVHSPGMYELPASARVGDALAKAGGLLADADPALVNQAEPLFDGAQVHVPFLQSPAAAAAPPSGLSGQSPPAASRNAPADGRVNINTATLEALTTLPGIGPGKAAAIIAERPFDSVEELERVPGIGPQILAPLTPLIKVRD